MILEVHDTLSRCTRAGHASSAATTPAALSLDAPIIAACHTRVFFLWDRRPWPARAHRSLPGLVRRRTGARALVVCGMRKGVGTAVCHRGCMAGRSVVGRRGRVHDRGWRVVRSRVLRRGCIDDGGRRVRVGQLRLHARRGWMWRERRCRAGKGLRVVLRMGLGLREWRRARRQRNLRRIESAPWRGRRDTMQ